MSERASAWQRAQRGWPPSFPLVQFPNAPLLAAFAAWLLAAVTSGDVHDYARGAFYVGVAAWAWLELADGVNWLRRLLGIGGLLYVTMQIAELL